MAEFDLKQVLFEELGYDNNPEVRDADQEDEGRSVPNVDQIYKVRDVQVAYFCRFQSIDKAQLWELHRAVWNESKTPLLFVVLPQEIRIYNGYALPSPNPDDLDNDSDRLLRHLRNIVDIETARREIRSQLYENSYDRLHLETGAFWDTSDGRRIDKSSRADNQLLRSMDILRRKLSSAGLAEKIHYAYTLIGRSIFARYLEDRNLLHHLFDQYEHDERENLSVISSLRAKPLAYRLFSAITIKFGGDLFPVLQDEENVVTQTHLDLVANFLEGTDLESGQLSFWPYDFEYIPIELISGIYDTFLNAPDKRGAGTYYTPHTLADFILDETMPAEIVKSDMKILDPACGSGVFLVRAYQRLIEAWIRENDGIKPDTDQLSKLMQSIYGVDVDENAIRIASFSLYLAMLDYLDVLPDVNNNPLQFPQLLGQNLFVGDFFSDNIQSKLNGNLFHRIIGNPPWLSKLSPDASTWVKKHQYVIGNKQIAQVFMLAAPVFCTADGEVALLMPAKGTFTVTRGTHRAFRKHLLENFSIRAVFNLSALRHEIFSGAIHPAVVVFYNKQRPELDNQTIIYVTPKPDTYSKRLNGLVIDSSDVSYLKLKEVLSFSHIWKVALWGNSRDAELIRRLAKLPSLKDVNDRFGFHMGEGIQIGGGKKLKAHWLTGNDFVATKNVDRYLVSEDKIETLREVYFHSPRVQRLTQAPLVLIRQSPTNGQCVAALHYRDISYTDTVVGLSGTKDNTDVLKWLVLYINSPLAAYYHFMTSTRWAIERDNIYKYEFEHMPCVVPEKTDERFKQALNLYSEIEEALDSSTFLSKSISRPIEEIESDITALVFDVFGLYPSERQLVLDTLKYRVDFFYWSSKSSRIAGDSISVEVPPVQFLEEYASEFISYVNPLLRYQKSNLEAIVYQNGSPLTVMGFKRVQFLQEQNTGNIHIEVSSKQLQNVLKRLNDALILAKSPSLYMRRHVRIYDGEWMYIVRPAEKRFWTRSQALADADEALAEWLAQLPSASTTEGVVN